MRLASFTNYRLGFSFAHVVAAGEVIVVERDVDRLRHGACLLIGLQILVSGALFAEFRQKQRGCVY